MIKPKFSIAFDDNVYLPGQIVSGTVSIFFSTSTTVRGVRATLLGRAKVEWTECMAVSCRRRHVKKKEVYIDEEVYVFGSRHGAKIRLEAGSHSYGFSFELPSAIPRTHDMGEYGDVRYTVMVVVERPWRPNAKSEPFPFIVVRPVDLNLEPAEFRNQWQTNSEGIVSVACCCCWTSGTVTGTMQLSTRCYVPGEVLFFSAGIENNSRSDVTIRHASLNQYVDLIAKDGSTFAIYRRLGRRAGPGTIPAGRTGTWNDVSFTVPIDATPRLDGCSLIKVSHTLTLCAKAPCCTKLELSADIVIGTVPLENESGKGLLPGVVRSQTAITRQLHSLSFVSQQDAYDNFVLVSHMRNVQRLISLTSVMGQIIVNPDLRPYIQ